MVMKSTQVYIAELEQTGLKLMPLIEGIAVIINSNYSVLKKIQKNPPNLQLNFIITL